MDIKRLQKISKKYLSNNSEYPEVVVLILNLYLLYSNYRQVFQVELDNTNDELLNEMKKIITFIKADYIIDSFRDGSIRMIVYNKDKFDINKLDMTFGKKYAKQLGEFYTCASDNYKKYNYQISISIDCNNTVNNIYIQMCNKNKITKNISKHIKIQNDLINIFKKYSEIKLNAIVITLKLLNI